MYGEDTVDTRNRVRAVVFHLINKSKKIRPLPNGGGWEVIGPTGPMGLTA